MTAVIFDGRKESELIKNQLRKRVAKLKKRGVTPGLAFLLVGNNPASESYVKTKRRVGNELGVRLFFEHQVSKSDFRDLSKSDFNKAIQKIRSWNKDRRVHGIIVQLPLPKEWDRDGLLNEIYPGKDVDGLTYINQVSLYHGLPCTVPATPRAIMEILKIMKAPVAHKHAVVIGRSALVGKPTALLLNQLDATVTIAHSRTWHLDRLTKAADILVSAAGVPGLIKPTMVKKGATVIDVGITKVPLSLREAKHLPLSLRGAKRRGNLVGDVSPRVAKIAGRLTPVPGGVGPMTVVMLYANLLDLIESR